MRHRPRSLSERISRSLELYPCDLLFIHRDAERAPVESRIAEIRESVKEKQIAPTPVICVVPVRMTEAWLLIDRRSRAEARRGQSQRQAASESAERRKARTLARSEKDPPRAPAPGKRSSRPSSKELEQEVDRTTCSRFHPGLPPSVRIDRIPTFGRGCRADGSGAELVSFSVGFRRIEMSMKNPAHLGLSVRHDWIPRGSA